MEQLYDMASSDREEYPESVNLGIEEIWWLRVQQRLTIIREMQGDIKVGGADCAHDRLEFVLGL
jgi:hypothetical protein